MFADSPAVVGAGIADASGPVETRPHRVSGAERMPGRRRMEQLRRGRGTEEAAGRLGGNQMASFDRGFVMNEMRRIAVISASLFALIVVLTLILR